MSEREIAEQCREAFPTIGTQLFSLEQLKESSADKVEAQKDLARELGFPEGKIEDRAAAANQCKQALHKQDWDREMAKEIKVILATVDEKIEQGQMSGTKEAQIMRVGAELVRPGTYGVPPSKEAPKLNDRQKAVFEALQQKEGIEVSLKKDNNNVYWIVAKHKA